MVISLLIVAAESTLKVSVICEIILYIETRAGLSAFLNTEVDKVVVKLCFVCAESTLKVSVFAAVVRSVKCESLSFCVYA